MQPPGGDLQDQDGRSALDLLGTQDDIYTAQFMSLSAS